MWDYATNPARWVIMVGHWRAVVQRLADPPVRWSPYIEQLAEPYIRYTGPVFDDPIRARAWCLTRITELKQ
jgi:hypothetical protein